MQPSRAAWCFAAGLAWLVLRGILVHAFPVLGTDHIAGRGGLLLAIPLLSVVAALTAPLFFGSLLRRWRWAARGRLRAFTMLAAAASTLAFLLVLFSFAAVAKGGGGPAGVTPAAESSWWLQAIPLFFVASIFLFLVAVSVEPGLDGELRRAATVASIGTIVPIAMMIAWIVYSQFDGLLLWYPGVSQSLGARILSVAAAASLLWFLETFASSGANAGAD